jgi:hypothetical protein
MVNLCFLVAIARASSVELGCLGSSESSEYFTGYDYISKISTCSSIICSITVAECGHFCGPIKGSSLVGLWRL